MMKWGFVFAIPYMGVWFNWSALVHIKMERHECAADIDDMEDRTS